jgi:hypothetical protein
MICSVQALPKHTYSKDVSSCAPLPEFGAVATHRHPGDEKKQTHSWWLPAKEQLLETHRWVGLTYTIRDSVWNLRVFYRRENSSILPAPPHRPCKLGVVQFNLL